MVDIAIIKKNSYNIQESSPVIFFAIYNIWCAIINDIIVLEITWNITWGASLNGMKIIISFGTFEQPGLQDCGQIQ